MVFPGVYLFTGLGFLMHECWHKYVPAIPHGFFYRAFSWMLVTDPQIYRLLHGSHHAQVNSWADAEFHPFGQIKSRLARIILNNGEIIFGIVVLVFAQTLAMISREPFRKKYRIASLLLAMLMWVFYLTALGFASHIVFSISPKDIVFSYVLVLWFGSLILHHSQLIEHGSLIVAGDWHERNVATRNLAARGWAEKFFLFLTHNDSREHVLHHTQVSIHSRPFPGRFALPQNAVRITLRDYSRILLAMVIGR